MKLNHNSFRCTKNFSSAKKNYLLMGSISSGHLFMLVLERHCNNILDLCNYCLIRPLLYIYYEQFDFGCTPSCPRKSTSTVDCEKFTVFINLNALQPVPPFPISLPVHWTPLIPIPSELRYLPHQIILTLSATAIFTDFISLLMATSDLSFKVIHDFRP